MLKMRRSTPWSLLVVALLCVPVIAADEDRTVTQAVQDATITARIETIFLLNEHLNPFRISTTTRNGVVTLEGTVDDRVERDLAEALAKSFGGVTGVDNRLAVERRETPRPVTAEDGTRARVQDANLTAAVRHHLAYDAELRDADIGVEAKDQAVRLYGTVPSEAAKERAIDIAQQTRGVLEVRSNLVVDPEALAARRVEPQPVDPAPAADEDRRGRIARNVDELARDLGDILSDEWVQARIQARLAWDRNVSLLNLKVDVKDGVAFLSGEVISDAQRNLAGSIARRTSGVRDVQNNIVVREIHRE
jgi:osmotically-inducible protein OsmY